LRIKVGGKIHRVSLQTKIESQARLRAPKEIDRLRTAHGGTISITGSMPSLSELLDKVIEAKENSPATKKNTVRFYKESRKALDSLEPDRPIRELTKARAVEWWNVTARQCSPTRANGARILLRAAVKMAIEAGWIASDPLISTKRARPSPKKKHVPTAEEFREMLATLASRTTTGRRGKAAGLEIQALVALLGFSGLRIAEALAMTWEDVAKDFLTVRGGAEGTKNREIRLVPIVPALRPWLDQFRPPDAIGKMFTIQSARASLKKFEISHHTLRHMFATRAMESGVDVRTVAGWLGHLDGGALLLKTYSHLLQGHSLAQSAKVAF
jgi:integrase